MNNKKKRKQLEQFLNMHSYGIVLLISCTITFLGLILQNKLFLDKIEDIEKLGELYIAVGATMFGSFICKKVNFYACCKGWYAIVCGLVIVCLSAIGFGALYCHKSIVCNLCIVLVAIVTTIMYDCHIRAENEREVAELKAEVRRKAERRNIQKQHMNRKKNRKS